MVQLTDDMVIVRRGQKG